MRYVIAVLAVAGIVVSCLALAQHYGAPAQPIDLTTLGLELRIRESKLFCHSLMGFPWHCSG